MTLEELIAAEIAIYDERWQKYKWNDTNETRALAVESERILKQLYRLKFGEEPTENPSQFIQFLND